MNIVLISTYELGHQPFGLTSAAAWLSRAGAAVTCCDLAVQSLDTAAVEAADLIGFYVPMHTATRIAGQLLPRVQTINPRAHIVCFGLYAPMNEPYLRKLGADTILGGEFEDGLVALVKRLEASNLARGPGTIDDLRAQPSQGSFQPEPVVSLARQEFILPDRRGLPHLSKYAYLIRTDGECPRVVGYSETTRGCKHLCRHCPIVPVYDGQFRVVPGEIVIEDIEQQVNSGAGHITFGDPDFFNGPGHAIPIVEKLHQLWPHLTYDVTIKIEHLLKHRRWLPVLRDTGCLFVTSAVESIDYRVLDILDKHHTREDFFKVAALFKEIGLVLHPTFVTFNPWTTLGGYLDLLDTMTQLDLVENVPPIQWAIRLLLPAGSKLLDQLEVRAVAGEFDEAALVYPWVHPDPRVDQLFERVLGIVKDGQDKEQSRSEIFDRVWQAACEAADEQRALPAYSRQPVSHLSENWYC